MLHIDTRVSSGVFASKVHATYLMSKLFLGGFLGIVCVAAACLVLLQHNGPSDEADELLGSINLNGQVAMMVSR